MNELWSGTSLVSNVFQLLGYKENALSKSLSWTFSYCPTFLKQFLTSVIPTIQSANDTLLRIQEYEDNHGRVGITDIEITNAIDYFVIIEAKRGWVLPEISQLEKYAQRESFTKSKVSHKALVVISDCAGNYAGRHLPEEIDGISVVHVSWDKLIPMARECVSGLSNAKKRVLKDLTDYLGGRSMRNADSNWVYVVSLGSGKPEGWDISWRDIVREKGMYFHPVGKNWPKEPPTYIAFRYDGKLQSIHHVEDYEVVEDMHSRISEIPSEQWDPHYLYKLGPEFAPQHEVPNGYHIHHAARRWVQLDTLFTSNTISDAYSATQKRISTARTF